MVIAMSGYWSIPGFEDLYLEDSWVLDITARPGVLEVVVDLVLRESHLSYKPPLTGERDHGSVDTLTATDDGYMVEGDFGHIGVASARPSVGFTS